MTTKPTSHRNDDSFQLLNGLWELCREVIFVADHIDRDALTDDDLEELEEIERITVGYSITLQEVESASGDDYPTVDQLRQLRLLVQDHCYRSLTALQATVNAQQGLNAEPLVLFDSEMRDDS